MNWSQDPCCDYEAGAPVKVCRYVRQGFCRMVLGRWGRFRRKDPSGKDFSGSLGDAVIGGVCTGGKYFSMVDSSHGTSVCRVCWWREGWRGWGAVTDEYL